MKRRKVFPDAARFSGSSSSLSQPTNPDAALSHVRHAPRHANNVGASPAMVPDSRAVQYSGSYPVMKADHSERSLDFSSQQLYNNRRPQPSGYVGQPYQVSGGSREIPRQAPRQEIHSLRSSPYLPGVSALLHSTGSPTHGRHPFDGGLRSSNGYMQQRPADWPSSRSPQDSPPAYDWSAVNAQAHHALARNQAPRYEREQQLRRQSQSLHLAAATQQPVMQGASRPQHLNGKSPSRESVASGSSSGDEDRGDATGSVGKNSRYLREMDRRAILERLSNGEKQATLAKEYQVSRAAICNLNKHRDEVMSRSTENPFAKHPKKRKTRPATEESTAVKPVQEELVVAATATVTPSPVAANLANAVAATVHYVKSRSVQLLLTKMRNQTTNMDEFRRCSERVMRLVIEDALALVPTKSVDVFLNDQVKVEGVGMEHAPCVISMEQHHCPMMDMFHLIEPDQPTGYVRLGTNRSITMLDAHLPPDLRYHNVFLFDTVAISGELVCAIIQRLKDRGAIETMLSVVALFVGSEVVAMVQCKFPSVRIVTAQIDSSLNSKTYHRSNLHTVVSRLDHMHNER